MKRNLHLALLLSLFFLNSCSGENEPPIYIPPTGNPAQTASYKYLALGDSYTIGQSVCESCRFPEQLKVRLEAEIPNSEIHVDIIAKTGWTTTNLLNAINNQNPAANYDLVTLLIGVNNQYQNKPFALYEQEFLQLVNRAAALAKGNKLNVVVVSIPDYRYTPFGNNLPNPEQVSQQIDQYNNFARNYCITNGIAFVDITGITRHGLENPELVASDGLHPSQLAYSQFIDKILPEAKLALKP